MSLFFSHAQPNWSVNSNDYQFSMTITATSVLNCDDEIDPNDLLAVFVDDSCRGVVDFGTSFENTDLAYLLIYSNQSQGEALTFKVYDESADEVLDMLMELPFNENGSLGSASNPILFSNTALPSDLVITIQDSIATKGVNDTLADFFVVDEFGGNDYSFTLSGAGNDNAFFSLSNNQLVAAQEIINQRFFTIEVTASNTDGCTITDTFFIDTDSLITNDTVIQPPLDIYFLGNGSILENNSLGQLIDVFEILDSSEIDQHSITLVPNVKDNAHFSITSNALYAQSVFDFELKDEYEIQVRVVDNEGLSLVKDLTINVVDVDENPVSISDLNKLSTQIFPNPTTDVLNVRFGIETDTYDYQIINTSGAIVLEGRIEGGASIKVDQLTSGWYRIHFKEEKSKFVAAQSFMKQ